MRYRIDPEKSRASFVAYAPMHKFKGWTTNSIVGQAEVNADSGEITNFIARAATMEFETGDTSRNKAMQQHFSFARYPATSFHTTAPVALKKRGNKWQGEITGLLELAGVRRQLPVNCILYMEEGLPVFEFSLKWSFTAFGMKVPRLLSLTVRDIVDISAVLRCSQEESYDIQ